MHEMQKIKSFSEWDDLMKHIHNYIESRSEAELSIVDQFYLKHPEYFRKRIPFINEIVEDRLKLEQKKDASDFKHIYQEYIEEVERRYEALKELIENYNVALKSPSKLPEALQKQRLAQQMQSFYSKPFATQLYRKQEGKT